MLIKLVEIKNNPDSGRYFLKEILINPAYIVSVEEEKTVTQEICLNEDRRPESLDARTRIVEVTLYDGKKYNIVGTPAIILKKISGNTRNTRNILKD